MADCIRVISGQLTRTYLGYDGDEDDNIAQLAAKECSKQGNEQ